MEVRCRVCKKVVTDPNDMNRARTKATCSMRCAKLAKNRSSLYTGILTLISTIIFHTLTSDYDIPIYIIAVILMYGMSLAAIAYGLTVEIKIKRIREEERLLEKGIVSGSEQWKPYLDKESVGSELSVPDQYFCFYCDAEQSIPIGEENQVCMTCGNKLPYCDLCSKYIVKGEEFLQVEPCGHIFHKKELLKWVENNKQCPKCKGIMDFVDISPDL